MPRSSGDINPVKRKEYTGINIIQSKKDPGMATTLYFVQKLYCSSFRKRKEIEIKR
jgi:hypothetical protein